MLSFQHAMLTAVIGVLLWAVREGWYWRRQVDAETPPDAEGRQAIAGRLTETMTTARAGASTAGEIML